MGPGHLVKVGSSFPLSLGEGLVGVDRFHITCAVNKENIELLYEYFATLY